MAQANRLYPIPHPPKRPIVGNLLSVDTQAPVQAMMELARRQGPIYWLDMLGTPIVVVSGFDLVEELCDEKRFDKAVRAALRRIRAFAGDGLFTAETQEANWGKAHNILLPTFGHRAMQAYHPMMLDIAEQLMLKWERLNPDDEIDVVHDMTALTLDTIGLAGFDYRFNSFYRRDNHPFVEAMVRALETIMKTRGLPLEELLTRERRRRLKADIDFMNGMVDDIVRERRENAAGEQTTTDLLGYMLSGVDKATGTRLDDVNIRYQIITFLIAGHETTSGMLSFALYFLLNHPDVLAKAYDEVDRVLGADVDAKPSFAQVNQLTYVSQVLKESLRLWPTAPAFGLYPYRDEIVGGQYRLKKRTFVTVLTPMLHRDKKIWGERADVFDPDNFTREAEAARPGNAYKPFGNGQRACIGRQFAMQEAALVVGMILQRFKLVDHTRYQLKIKETLTLKPDGFVIKVRPRTDRDRKAAAPTVVSTGVPSPARQPAARPSHGTPLLVLFGSNLGTSEELARHIAESGDINGFKTELASLDDRAGTLPSEGAAVIVSASYNGVPPDNATQFCRWLNGDLAAGALSGVNYAVFGCGNRDWASTYQSVPRMIDERLAAAGARRLYGRGEGDAREDLDGQFQSWFAELLPSVAKELGVDVDLSEQAKAEPLYEVETVGKPAVNPIIGSVGAVPMQIVVNRELHKKSGPVPSDRSTRHVEVLLPEGMSYRPGDHLSVVPRNGAALVERAMRRFGFEPDAHVRLSATGGRRPFLPVGEAIAVHRLLADYVEMQHVATRKQIATLAEYTRCPHTKPALMEIARDDEGNELYRNEVLAPRKSALDLLERFPACELPFNVYLDMLPLMAPRYYSISSSPALDPRRLSITVGVIEGPARSGQGTYQGVCSNHLLRQAEGGVVDAVVKETKVGFRLPEDPSRPIIMIGPGTGLAPFRGFLQERATLKEQGKTLGPAMLFFGCRHREQDFIYADELGRFADDDIVELHAAFSRMEGEKVYVQDLIRREKDKVWSLIEAGAIIYVCGDGSRMEPDVKRTLVEIWRKKTGAEEAAAEQWMLAMGGDNRYVLDVWTGN